MTEENKQFEVRDLRERNKFVVDDKFLNGYARFLGIYCVGVYNSFCRHANKEQKCWPSIKKVSQELNICRNKVIGSIKYLEFWQIIEKQRIGKMVTNRYFLLDKKRWKPLNETNLKEFSEVHHINFTSLRHKLQEFITSTSIVRKHNSNETQKKGGLSFKELADAYKKGERKYKPFFWEDEMRWSQNRWWVIKNGEWLKFDGNESEIEWR
jgi:predicted transcriptional regulator